MNGMPDIMRGLAAASNWIRDNGALILTYAAVTVALYAILVVLRGIARRVVGRPDRFDPNSWREIAARTLQRTRSFFLVAIAAKLVTVFAAPPADVIGVVQSLLTAAIIIQVAIWVREFVLAIIARRAAASDPADSTLVSAMGVIRLVVGIGVWAVAAVVILDNLGVNVTALVAGLGIGGIAIGLAAQGIFSDLFAALSILFDRPFVRGDTITVDTLTGTVEKIGLKTTRVRALSGEIVSVSNAKLLENRIHNLALVQRRRVVMTLGVTYQTPPALLEALPAELHAVVARCGASFDRAHAVAFGPSSIDVELVFHVESAELADMIAVRHAVIVAIVRRFAELGVAFAYPTQTTFTAAPDGRMVLPYFEPPSAS